MKIAVMCERFNMGGTEKAIFALANKMIEQGHSVDLITTDNAGPLKDDVPENVNVVEMKFHNKLSKIIASNTYLHSLVLRVIVKGIRKYLNIFDKDIHDLLLDNVDSLPDEYDAALEAYGYGSFTTAFAARKIDAPKKALWFHVEKIGWLKAIEPYLDGFDKFYCVSNSVKKNLVKQIPDKEDKCEVLYNFINPNDIIKKANDSIDIDFSNKFSILSVGRLVDQKGFDLAIEIAKKLKDDGKEFCWYIIGGGANKEKYEKAVSKFRLEDYLKFLGPKLNPYPYMRACDLYVQPSRFEGYPITIIEARALKKIIVATNIESFSEQIHSGVNGYLVDFDAGRFADTIKTLMDNVDERKRILYYMENEYINFDSEYKKLEQFLKK